MMEDFEKDIKKHFQERQIQPSENAWNKMQTFLDEQQPKQKTPKKLFYFLSAAASVLLFVGLWTFFQKVDHSIPETKPGETFVVNGEQETMKPAKSEKQEKEVIAHHPVEKNDSKRKTPPKLITEEYIVLNSDVPKEEIVSIPEKEEIIPVHKIKEKPLIAARSNVEIKVDPERLLRSAEIERQIENATTEGQSFWKKVAEKHHLVHSH